MSIVGRMHTGMVFGRRVRTLAEHLSKLLPDEASILDVGCGDGSLDEMILMRKPGLNIRGIDVLVRENARIPVEPFDGLKIPFNDNSFDIVMFVDVLHHASDPAFLLGEAKRVCRKGVVIKDHAMDGMLAETTLRFMDWVGNAHHGVALPYNYWAKSEWDKQIGLLGLRRDIWKSDIGIYPWPASVFFDRELHFIASLMKTQCP